MHFIKDLLFPKICVGCGAIGSFICFNCQNRLIFSEKQRCFQCREPSLYGFTHPSCRRNFGLDGVVSLYLYNPFLKKLLKTAKYRLAKEALNELLNLTISPTGLLLFSSRSPFKTLPLLPIPLHRSRMSARGFNQSDIICKFMRSLRPEVEIIDLLERVRNTPAQAQLKSKLKRYLNTTSAFKVKKKLLPSEVMLVDDVITTGSTIRSATEVLKRAGVKRVYAFSLGHG